MNPIDPSTIVRVYSGKPGCGCGCNGKYYEDTRNIRRVVKKINERIGTGAGVNKDPDGTPFCYYVEDRDSEGRGRYYWAYTRRR